CEGGVERLARTGEVGERDRNDVRRLRLRVDRRDVVPTRAKRARERTVARADLEHPHRRRRKLRADPVLDLWERHAGRIAPSSSRRARFTCRPPAYPVSDPFAPTTRWQGSTIGIGFRFMTVPTARAARGRPTFAASEPQVG